MKAHYLCPYCSTRFETYDALKAHVVAEHGTESLPKPGGLITLTINGQRYDYQVEPSMTLAIECDGKTIETVEGIAQALLGKNPDPTEDEIRETLAGNLCRCGTYPRIVRAIERAAREA